MRHDKFYVYILEFDNGDFYIGYTPDIGKQLSKHKNQETPSPAGRNPKLQYLQVVATEKAAELREAELKRLLISNPEQLRLMALDFRGHMHDLGYDDLGL